MRSEGYPAEGTNIDVGLVHDTCEMQTMTIAAFCRTMGCWRECDDDSDKCEHGGSTWLLPEETLYLVQEDKLRLHRSVDRANEVELAISLFIPCSLLVVLGCYCCTH